MLLVIGAMKKELHEIIKNNTYHVIKDILGNEYHNQRQNYLIVISDIGLTNASLSLSHWLTKYPQISQILVLGTAGSINSNLHQGEVCFVNKAFYGTVDLTAFGYQFGKIPQMPINYNLTSFNHDLKQKFQLKSANIVSSDIFISEDKQIKFLKQNLTEVCDLVDMEMAAFCQVAFRFKIPISAIKVVSDCFYDTENSSLSFDQFLSQAAIILKDFFNQYLKKSALLN